MSTTAIIDEVTCPFCGLLCDDLTVAVVGTDVKIRKNACPLSREAFHHASSLGETSPRVDGQAVSLQHALDRAAEVLKRSRWPLIAGLACDVNGARAAIGLAERCGGVVDHVNGDALFANLKAMQNDGWVSTSLSEARNRADLLVVFGKGVFERYPRFAERVLRPEQTLYPERSREVVVLEQAQPGETAAVLRALLRGAPLRDAPAYELDRLSALAGRLTAADYSVLVWAAAEFASPHAELAVQNIIALAREVNETTRCAALPLGGDQGSLTAQYVCSWHSGFSLRTSFQGGFPDYDPYRYAVRPLVEENAVDALLWIAAFNPATLPPSCDLETIVLGHAGLELQAPPAVYIPVGIPGIDHAGQAFRCDGVALTLKRLRDSGLPTTAEVIRQIRARLP